MFDLTTHVAAHELPLLEFPEGRRVLTELDPLLFALVYLPHHLRGPETGDVLSFSEAHTAWCELAKRYVRPISVGEPGDMRDTIIAPRGCGKSTWWFTIIPLWLAAHGHRQFLAAFANSATQAQDHLGTFKRETEHGELLRADFPDLCTPARRPSGVSVSDSQSMYIARSGFVFAARGIDSQVLGLKIGTRRPDHLILDDVEGTEGNYSPAQKASRLATITSGILPMNNRASVTMAGTVAIPGAIIDDVAAKQRGDEYPAWVDDEGFTPRYWDVIQTDDDGSERSLWPERWSMAWINRNRHIRSFQSQMRNDPMAADTAFWGGDDFAYRDDVAITHQLLSIDPAVTTKAKSDYTALAVIGYSRPEQVCVVRAAWQVKIPPGEKLRARVLQILDAYPDISGVVVETNQGGDAWLAILHDLPVTVRTITQSRPKEVRAGSLLAKYQRGRVFHEKRLPQLEAQMLRFPLAEHDDLVDAVGTGVEVFLKNDKQPREVRAREAGGMGEGGDDDD
jgi:phage terminase large subunit-like protein